MPQQIRSRLRLSWYVLISGVTITSVLPGISLRDPRIAVLIDHTWVHFVVYTALAAIPLLGWRLRAGIALTSGTAILSVVLQVIHAFVSGHGIDAHGTMINLLGVLSGILLGLNIVSLRTRTKYRDTKLTDRIHD
jgi:hypothetical protein